VQVNTEIVQIQRVQTAAGEAQLRNLIQTHVDNSESVKGAAILDDWANQLPKFWQLVPPSEAGTPEAFQEEITVAEKEKVASAA
jgi:glutamate synthase (ferredoxin)